MVIAMAIGKFVLAFTTLVIIHDVSAHWCNAFKLYIVTKYGKGTDKVM